MSQRLVERSRDICLYLPEQNSLANREAAPVESTFQLPRLLGIRVHWRRPPSQQHGEFMLPASAPGSHAYEWQWRSWESPHTLSWCILVKSDDDAHGPTRWRMTTFLNSDEAAPSTNVIAKMYPFLMLKLQSE